MTGSNCAHSVAPRVGRPWRIASSAVMGLTAVLAKGFIYYLNQTTTVGLPEFLEYLEGRRHGRQERGLITISNHMSVLDDPLMWGVLPLRMACDPSSMRWGLGAHDICFQSKAASTFFGLGQVLPTYRLQHSTSGGLFQPTMTQAIRLLSRQCTSLPDSYVKPEVAPYPDLLLNPAAYADNHLRWLHVFPEGRVIQKPGDDATGYFKWGVSRLILETDPAPDVIPIFIEGTQHIMPEDRGWPKWLPRIGAPVRILFGKPFRADIEFSEHRARWSRLALSHGLSIGTLTNDPLADNLKQGEEACKLRMDVAAILRSHVAQLSQEHQI